MHYFSLNIKDYAWATRTYDAAGRLAYLELCMRYIDQEGALQGDAEAIARQIGMRENAGAVAEVLRDHFRETKRGWVSNYLDEILKTFDEKRKRARAAAGQASKVARERRLQRSEIGSEIGSEIETKIETQPITNNHEPITKNQKEKTSKKAPRVPRASVSRPEDVPQQIWDDWIRVRGRVPLTQTAWGVILSEAKKAGVTPAKAVEISAGHGWRGFKAEWLQNKARGKRTDDLAAMDYAPAAAAAAGFTAGSVWNS